MHEYRILNFVHTFINNRDKLPDIFVSSFVENRYIHYYDTRIKCYLHLTSMQSSIGKNLFQIRVVVYEINYQMRLN